MDSSVDSCPLVYSRNHAVALENLGDSRILKPVSVLMCCGWAGLRCWILSAMLGSSGGLAEMRYDYRGQQSGTCVVLSAWLLNVGWVARVGGLCQNRSLRAKIERNLVAW